MRRANKKEAKEKNNCKLFEHFFSGFSSFLAGKLQADAIGTKFQ